MRVIKNRGKELTKKEIYKMTKDNGLIMMKDVDDNTLIDVVASLEFVDEKENGDVTIYSIMDKDGNCYAYQSKTFHNSLNDILDIMEDENTEYVSIIKISGTTKSDRNFINCKLA